MLLACLAGAAANVYTYELLILLAYQSEALKAFLIWNVGGQRIPLFGRLPWCMLAQLATTAAAYAWWSRRPPAGFAVAAGVLLGAIVNALLLNALALW